MTQPTSRFARYRAAFIGLILALLVPLGAQAAEDPVKLKSLRGAEVPAADPVGECTRYGPDTPVLPRDFVQQPPLIPHKVEGYEVTLNFNKCMDCHAWSRYKESGATKVSLTHFKDRDGGELSNISPRRYFCMQCHVSQENARPIVENKFQDIDTLIQKSQRATGNGSKR